MSRKLISDIKEIFYNTYWIINNNKAIEVNITNIHKGQVSIYATIKVCYACDDEVEGKEYCIKDIYNTKLGALQKLRADCTEVIKQIDEITK